MARALAWAAVVLCVAAEVDVECSGSWTSLRGSLYRAANPQTRDHSDAAFEALAVVADFQRSATIVDCPLGSVAIHLVEGLQLEHDVRTALEADFNILQAFGWRMLIRSGWPIFQLLLLLHKHVSGLAGFDVCAGDSYARSLHMALQHQAPPGMGLTAQSLLFLSSPTAQSCASLASAAILAMAWTRLPIYDIETEGLLTQAELRTTLLDLVFSDVSHPLPLTAARLSAASQLSMHLPEPPASSREAGCDKLMDQWLGGKAWHTLWQSSRRECKVANFWLLSFTSPAGNPLFRKHCRILRTTAVWCVLHRHLLVGAISLRRYCRGWSHGCPVAFTWRWGIWYYHELCLKSQLFCYRIKSGHFAQQRIRKLQGSELDSNF